MWLETLREKLGLGKKRWAGPPVNLLEPEPLPKPETVGQAVDVPTVLTVAEPEGRPVPHHGSGGSDTVAVKKRPPLTVVRDEAPPTPVYDPFSPMVAAVEAAEIASIIDTPSSDPSPSPDFSGGGGDFGGGGSSGDF